jgi:hypothetical protein
MPPSKRTRSYPEEVKGRSATATLSGTLALRASPYTKTTFLPLPPSITPSPALSAARSTALTSRSCSHLPRRLSSYKSPQFCSQAGLQGSRPATISILATSRQSPPKSVHDDSTIPPAECRRRSYTSENYSTNSEVEPASTIMI